MQEPRNASSTERLNRRPAKKRSQPRAESELAYSPPLDVPTLIFLEPLGAAVLPLDGAGPLALGELRLVGLVRQGYPDGFARRHVRAGGDHEVVEDARVNRGREGVVQLPG